jgi:hypothetical protein
VIVNLFRTTSSIEMHEKEVVVQFEKHVDNTKTQRHKERPHQMALDAAFLCVFVSLCCPPDINSESAYRKKEAG